MKPYHLSHASDIYSLDINQKEKETTIIMKLFTSVVTTHSLPRTVDILLEFLPSIYRCRCFNDNKFSFYKEVQGTEIGHLFEHILIEYIYQLKLYNEKEKTVSSGETTWNWNKDPFGTFYITVNSGYKDAVIFKKALKKSIKLTNFILKELSQKQMAN